MPATSSFFISRLGITCCVLLFTCCRKVAFRRRTRRLQPATDIHLRMRLAAVMPSPFGRRCFCIPLNHGQFCTATSNYEPVDRIGTHRATHLTSELCNRRHRDYPPCELIQSPTIARPRSRRATGAPDGCRQSSPTTL